MFNFKLKSQISYSYTCQDSGCLDEGICRCSRVKNFKIEVDFLKLAREIYDDWIDTEWTEKGFLNRFRKIIKVNHNYNYDEVNIFSIYKLLLIYNISNDDWQPNIIKGYYGEEIESFSLKQEIAKNLKRDINKILSTVELTKRIRFILRLEGTKIPNRLIAEVITIDSDLIDSNNIGKSTKEIPTGIALYSNRYKVISGWSVDGTNKLIILKKKN